MPAESSHVYFPIVSLRGAVVTALGASMQHALSVSVIVVDLIVGF